MTVEDQLIASSSLSTGTVEALLLSPNTGGGISQTIYSLDLVEGVVTDSEVSGSVTDATSVSGSVLTDEISGVPADDQTIEATIENNEITAQ